MRSNPNDVSEEREVNPIWMDLNNPMRMTLQDCSHGEKIN